MFAPSFAVLLLAGGRSRRMGQDKAILDWQGRPLWRMQVDKLRVLNPACFFIGCREEQGLHEASTEADVQWLFDPPGEDCGPMGAVIRALEQADLPVLVLAVDMPCMSGAFLVRLVADAKGCSLFFSLEERIEPLAGLYSPALLPLLKAAREAGNYSLQKVLRQACANGLVKCREVTVNETGLFANANTPEEWQAALPAGSNS